MQNMKLEQKQTADAKNETEEKEAAVILDAETKSEEVSEIKDKETEIEEKE